MLIPNSFKNKIIGCFGEEGRTWLGTLEERVKWAKETWQLKIDGPVANLSYNYVLKAVDSSGMPVILKLGVPGVDFTNEIKTLELYNGNGCAHLLSANPDEGAFLLEQLVPGTMLTEVENEYQALDCFMEVWQAIRRPVPIDYAGPTVLYWAKGLDRYLDSYPSGDGPIPFEFVDQAKAFFLEVTQTSEGEELLHGDLHHQNILYSNEKGWLAIDPKGVAGDPYFGLISYLVNELHNKRHPKELLEQRVDYLVQKLKLKRDRFLKAAVAMAVLYACWSIEDHDSEWDKTFQCAVWFEEFRKSIIK